MNVLKRVLCRIFSAAGTAPEGAALLFSGIMVAAAYGFEYLGGYPPCELCWTQRYAHMGVIGMAALLFLLRRGQARRKRPDLRRASGGLLGLGLLTSAGIAGFHAGVEYKWWQGPDACTAASGLGGFDPDQILDTLMNAPLVSCGDVVWELFGISMAGYNFLLSLGMALLLWTAVKGVKNA